MTATLQPVPGAGGTRPGGPQSRLRVGRRTGPGRGPLARHPAWPVVALLIGYPLWWALGLADFMWIILAVPMALRILAWRAYGSRRLRLPPGFGIWLLFLLCSAAGVAVLTLTAPGTVPSPVSHRVLSYGDRTLTYLGVTILLLYAGNLTERELPRKRFAWMLGLLAIYTTAGGVAGMVMHHVQFDSPFLLALPKSVQANPFIQASMRPGLAQVQNVFGGGANGRPKAPFDYTNTWGECLSILLPWLLVGWWVGGKRRQRWIAGATVVVCVAPLLYSLNRGVWIGVGISIFYLALRLAARGRLAMIGALFAVIALAGILVLVSPLHNVVSGRLSNGGSANLRSNLSALSVQDALASPVIGYGDTRQERGSPTSIAVGPSPKCPTCGQLAVGSTGQLWLLLVCSGFVGAACYLGFFAYGIWRFRHDRSPYGVAGVLVLLLSFVYMFTYDAVGAALGLTMLSYALLWKDQAWLGSGSQGEDDGSRVLRAASGPTRWGIPPVTAGRPA
jgi:hypothetical protein